MGRGVIDSDEKVETQRSKLLLTLGYNKSWIFHSYPGLWSNVTWPLCIHNKGLFSYPLPPFLFPSIHTHKHKEIKILFPLSPFHCAFKHTYRKITFQKNPDTWLCRYTKLSKTNSQSSIKLMPPFLQRKRKGQGKKKRIYVYICLIHDIVQQKLTRECKATISQ